MEYEDALNSSIEMGYSYMFHKYQIAPSIISFSSVIQGTRTGIYPFQIPYEEDKISEDHHIIDMDCIGTEISCLATEGYMESDGDLNDSRLTPFSVPIPDVGIITNQQFRPFYNFLGVSGFENRTKDAVAVFKKINKAAKKFMFSLVDIDRQIGVNSFIIKAIKAVIPCGYPSGEDDERRRITYGMSDSEYLFVLSKINYLIRTEIYEPYHLTDPDALYYLFRDFDGFCKEYEMDGVKREVVDLYRRCFKDVYVDIYVHIMHWGNFKYMRSLKHEKLEMFNDVVLKVTRSNTDEIYGFGFTGDGADISTAIEIPCSMGATSLFIMKEKKGYNNE